MVLNGHRNHKANRNGKKGGSTEVGEEVEYLYLYYHHQNVSCIKMGSDESHFNVSLIVRDKVTRQCPQTVSYTHLTLPTRSTV